MRPINHEKTMMRFVRSGHLIIMNYNIYRKSRNPYYPFNNKIETVNRGGYINVKIESNGELYCCYAHRLIWHYHRGPIPRGMQINHKNGIKTDNRISNLELVTPKMNYAHAIRIGLYDNAYSLTNAEIQEIKALHAIGEYRQTELASIYGITQAHISYIVNNKRRKSA